MVADHIDKDRVALGIQQPWAELVMMGIKTIEVRTLNTNRRGPIYIYASRKMSKNPHVQSTMEEYGLVKEELAFGQLLGSVNLVDCRRCELKDSDAACLPGEDLREYYGWILENPKPFPEPVDVKYLPYGVWFYPFKRKNQE